MIIRNKARWLATITLIWIFAGLLVTIHEYFFLSNYEGVLLTDSMSEYDFLQNLVAAGIWGLLGGLTFGLLELVYFQKYLSRKKFLHVVGHKILTFAFFLVILNVIISFLFNSLLSGRSFKDPAVFLLTRDFATSMAFWHPVIPFVFLSMISAIVLQLAERFGSTELWKLVTGKYFEPKEESRIFMFLDLKASTSIAERLGNEKFYQFLNDFYHDISEAIINNRGEVVEYVGDQIVITWTLPNGTREANCLKCFYDFETEIRERSHGYLSKYGVVPEFKAAVHCGDVMIGEIGRIKKSIKFSGDVLNTTARVEKICKDIGAKMAVTGNLVALFDRFPFPMEKVPRQSLKGKSEEIDIFRVVGQLLEN